MSGLLQVIFLLLALVPAPVLSTLNQTEANKRRLAWMLSFPYSRRLLLGARLLAVWLSILKWFSGVLLAYGAGIGMRAVMDGPIAYPRGNAVGILPVELFAFLLLGLLTSCLTLGQPLAFRSRIAAWLLLPVMIGANYIPLIFYNWTDRWLQKGILGSYFWLWAVLAIIGAILLASLTFSAVASLSIEHERYS